MARLTNEEIDNLKFSYGVDILYSWSKIQSFLQDKWEYYLKYVIHQKPDQEDSLYASIGNSLHDKLERFYTENISNEVMVKELENDYLYYSQLIGKKFVRGTAEEQQIKNDKLARNYLNSCIDFLHKTKKIAIKYECEKFFPCLFYSFASNLKCDHYLLQCYIDFIEYTKDGNVNIIDYKTSTAYSGKKIDEKKGQLQIYGLAYLQNTDIDISKIKLFWNFVKYVTVEYSQKNGKIASRNIERCKLGGELNNDNVLSGGLVHAVKMFAKDLKYNEEETNDFINNLYLTNSIDCLPKEIQDKFTFKECLIEVPFNDDELFKLNQLIVGTIEEIEQKEELYQQTKDENIFWQDVSYNDLFMLQNLSPYSRLYHKPLDVFLKQQEEKEQQAKLELEALGMLNNNQS